MPALSRSLERFPPSTIASIFALATRLKEQGRDIVNLSTGEPDFDTNVEVRNAAKRAIDEGQTRYTPVDGTTALKKAIQKKFAAENGLDYALDEIVVDSGAKPLLAHIMLALLDPGDEVVIPTPCWTSHPGAVRFCGATPVLAETREDRDFKLLPEELEPLLGPKVKLLIL
ncbi:MAG: aminotransferase class I/II-fold pyridoxal phosphate-dependent enzyme, partial [Kiloniellales bacterium]|nr:aminotransferase class I/II-fold pyridoxal phosphate-dependent enzyme [Kiloniellales bacterium]